MSGLKAPWPGLIEAYREHLPVTDATPVITLLEGGTPLLRAERLSAELDLEIWLKIEGANPTGSFKDRGMTMAITKAVETGAKVVVCASTGNTSASAAAYAARAGLTCGVVIPEGQIALGKLAQALIHGARVVPVRGNFDQALDVVRELGRLGEVTVVNSINPFRIEGQKTAAFEVVDALGDAPDVHCVPVGNAGNITAYWRGYVEYERLGRSGRTPRMLGWQARGAAPLVRGEPVLHPETIATAIRIGNPASWDGAVAARDESGGSIGDGQRRPDPRRLPRARRDRGRVRGARVRSVGGRPASRRAAERAGGRGRAGRVHGDRSRAEGPAARDRRGAAGRARSPPSLDAVATELGLH